MKKLQCISKRVSRAGHRLQFRSMLAIASVLGGVVTASAQTSGAGQAAFQKAASEIKLYEDDVQKLMYAIASVIAIVGAFNIYFKMQNGDQDVKKTIMLTIGGCIAFVALAEALPLFFGTGA